MVAETSINDVLLVVAGGAIGIVGSYFSHQWARTHRSAERIATAYSEYIAASEQVLKTTISAAKSRTACERVPDITATDDAVRDFLFGRGEQAEDAQGRQLAAYFVVILRDPDAQRRARAAEFQKNVLDSCNNIGNTWTNESNVIMSGAYKELAEFMASLEGQFSK